MHRAHRQFIGLHDYTPRIPMKWLKPIISIPTHQLDLIKPLLPQPPQRLIRRRRKLRSYLGKCAQ